MDRFSHDDTLGSAPPRATAAVPRRRATKPASVPRARPALVSYTRPCMADGDNMSNGRAAALAAMQTLMAGLEGRLVRQRILPHPGDGALYDVDANRLSRRSQARGDLTPGGKGPFLRREAVGLLHRPMLGAWGVKVCAVLDFADGDGERFTAESVAAAAQWAMTDLRPDVFFVIGVAGVNTRPDLPPADDALRALTGGTNWRAAFIEYLNPGWRVNTPRDGVILPALFENLFDPEPQDQKIARVDAALGAAQELKEPGGFVLIDELARRAAVAADLVADRAMLFAGRTPGLELKDVDGNLILQRNRFSGVGAK